MDKHARRSGPGSILHYPVLAAFTLFFAGLFVLDLLTPDRAYSELENTTLAQRPTLAALSAQGLNDYFTDYTQYVKDQVFARDQWVGLQSLVETTLLQKTESGGILLGEEGQMFPRRYSLLASEARTLPRNSAALAALCQRWPGRVNVLLAPSAATIYPERVPAGAPLLPEADYLAQLAQTVADAGGRWLDASAALAAHKDEYIYYRTDHHWTSIGAYHAYEQLCAALGLEPFDASAHMARSVGGFYGTHYSKARTWNARPDTLSWFELDCPLTIYEVTAAGQPESGEQTTLYDLDKLTVYDKYAMFLHGNNGLSRIEGEGEGRILVIKDSYANCFVPYLTANFAQIDVVDLRNYNYGLDALDADNQYDQVLVLYSFDSFKSDPYFYRAGIAG